MPCRVWSFSFFVLLILNFSNCSKAEEGGAVRKPIPSEAEINKLPKDGGEEFNRLIFSQSPYLLQHARNPVDWYPWGEEAFAKAKKENKPVFMSIGYTTCHWCHVMEHESFEDDEVAALMNKHFICIKVDREERPDIDQIYMAVTQAMTGSGGWPMTIMMTPDKKPFFAGTYFPKRGRFNRPGMMELLPRINQLWTEKNDQITQDAERISQYLVKMQGDTSGDDLTSQTLAKAFSHFERSFDETHGGFKFGRNKFPTAHNLSFLLRYWKRSENPQALKMVEKTLSEMRKGGIYDHVGLGFHRYSVDAEWKVPHFEKMLYDQAINSIAYLECYQATGKQEYADTAREIFEYVLRDMTAPEGGFYSAEDADSEGVEGKFYLWSPAQVRNIVGKDEGNLYCKVYNIIEGGNFQDEATGETPGTSIPLLKKSLAEFAKELKLDEKELKARLEKSRRKLFLEREKRIHPQKDDKILTDWNGLMIAALAQGAQVLDDQRYADAAKKAADFTLDKLRNKDGRLLKRYRNGNAGLPAHLEDYAYFIWGLNNLYEATFDAKYLQASLAQNEILTKHFWDAKLGGYFMTADDGETLIVRSKDIYDGARPSGNSVMMLNLLRLGRITGNADFEHKAYALGKAFSGRIELGPGQFTFLMQALDFAVGPSFEVVISGEAGKTDTQTMLRKLRKPFVPNKVVLLRGKEAGAIAKIAPYTESQAMREGKATAYVCQNFACKMPVTDPEKMLDFLLNWEQ